MDAIQLQKMKMPELRSYAKSQGITWAKRWSKSKLIEEIVSKEQIVNPQNSIPEKDDFLNDNFNNPEIKQDQKPEFEKPLRGGKRDNAGRPQGTDENHNRLKEANKVAIPDINIKAFFQFLSRFAKKPIEKELIENTSLYTTKTAKYFGVLEMLENTPLFLLAKALIYLWQFIKGLGLYERKPKSDKPKKPDKPKSKEDNVIRNNGFRQIKQSEESYPGIQSQNHS